MTKIATVSATIEGEQVEDHTEIDRRGLSSILGAIFDDEDVSFVVHEVHDEEQIEDLKARYSNRWEARVEDDSEDDGSEEFGFGPIVGLTAVECPDCGYAEVADTPMGVSEHQCSNCLSRFGSARATFHAPGDDPRDVGADVHEAY